MYFLLFLVKCYSISYFPKSGPVSGGTKVRISDYNFIPTTNLSCTLNNTLVPTTYINTSNIECTTIPIFSNSTLKLYITGIETVLIGDFVFYSENFITSILPLSGSELLYTKIYLQSNYLLSTDVWAIQISDYVSVCFNNLLCTIPPLAVLKKVNPGISNVLPILVSRNNQQFHSTNFYFTYLLSETQILNDFRSFPYHGPSFGGTIVQIVLSTNITMVNPGCLFGNITIFGVLINSTSFSCKSPAGIGKVSLKVTINGFDYSTVEQEFVFDKIIIYNYYPTQGTITGGSFTIVKGYFMPYSTVFCKFGNSLTIGVLLLTMHVNCTTPANTASTVDFLISFNAQDFYYVGPYTFRPKETLASIFPSTGPNSGGTAVRATMNYLNSTTNAYCRIGLSYKTRLQANNTCYMPPMSLVGSSVKIYVSSNDIDYESFLTYNYYQDFVLSSISPSFVPNTLMQRTYNITGSGFINTSLITVLLMNKTYSGVFNSTTLITFTVSDKLSIGKLNISLSLNGQNYSPNQLYLEVFTEPKITSINPSFGFIKGGIRVGIRGSNFVYSSSLFCNFDSTSMTGTFVSSSLIYCQNPSLTTNKTVLVSVSFNNRYNFTNTLPFVYIQTPVLPLISSTSSYNQARLQTSLNYNPPYPPLLIKVGQTWGSITKTWPYSFTLQANPAGVITFSVTYNYLETQSGLSFTFLGECVNGYYCPVSNNYTQILCPAGFYCNTNSLIQPVPCSPGNFSLTGSVLCSVCIVGKYCPYIAMTSPLSCPPGYLCNKTSIAYQALACPAGYTCENNKITDCPSSFWCGNATVFNNFAINNDYRTPQLCKNGVFCLKNSKTSYGEVCPLGYYCKQGVLYDCPIAKSCGLSGLWQAISCLPGFYNPIPNQSFCFPCSVGFICPNIENIEETICPAGYVCSIPGRASPFDVCPAGSYCLEGVSTTEIGTNNSPILCDSGTYCLIGCESGVVFDGNVKYAQTCIQGSYCVAGEGSPAGVSCPEGYFCPAGSSFPSLTEPGYYSSGIGNALQQPCPAGNFSDTFGAVFCNACPAGFYCPYDRMVQPIICPPGTYRELTSSSIYCDLCPEGTFSTVSGLVSVSQCEKCDASIICLGRGLSSLNNSTPCPEGYVCTNGTTSSSLINSPCPGGFWCGIETSTPAEYEICDPGYYCPQATGSSSQHQFVCLIDFYCPPATNGELNSNGTYDFILSENYTYVIEAKQKYNEACMVLGCPLKNIQNFTVCPQNLRIPEVALNSYSSLQCPKGTNSPNGAVCVGQCVAQGEITTTINPTTNYNVPDNELALVVVKPLTIALFMVEFSILSSNLYYNTDFSIEILDPNNKTIALPSYFQSSSSFHINFNISLINLSQEPLSFSLLIGLHNDLFIPVIPDLQNTITISLLAPQRAIIDESALFASLLWLGSFSSSVSMPYNMLNLLNDDGSEINPWLVDTGANLEWNGTAYSSPLFDDTFWANYELSSVAFPWLPFFMNCEHFGDRIYIHRLTENMENCTLYNTSETVIVYPLPTSGINPKADTCNIYLRCFYAEDVQPTSSKRWFEINEEKTLFFLTKYAQDPTAFAKTLKALDSDFTVNLQNFDDSVIQVKFYPAAIISGIPTTVTMNIAYYQKDLNTKHLVFAKVILSDYSTDELNAANPGYLLIINYYPLGWFELMNDFQFDLSVYFLIFVIIGIVLYFTGLLAYKVHICFVKDCPALHFSLFFWISSLPKLVGISLACLPMIFVFFGLNFLAQIFSTVTTDWVIVPPLTSEQITENTVGRVGMCIGLASFCFLAYGSRLLIPKPDQPEEEDEKSEKSDEKNEEKIKKSARNKEVFTKNVEIDENLEEITDAFNEETDKDKNEEEKQEEDPNETQNNENDENNSEDEKFPYWFAMNTKRRYFILACLVTSAITSIKLEISYTTFFPPNIVLFQIMFSLADILIYQIFLRLILSESLLVVPIITSLFINKAIMMMASSKFTTYLECYFINCGFIMVQRIYINPFIEYIEEKVKKTVFFLVSNYSIPRKLLGKLVINQLLEEKKLMSHTKWSLANQKNNEKMMGSMVEFSAQSVATFMLPLVYFLISIYANESQIPKKYGIKQSNLFYYLLFSFVIIFPQMIIDVYLLHLLEALYDYKIYDYLSYCAYRYKTRTIWWKFVVEAELDKSLLPIWRSLDFMCFSSQFYFAVTLASWGIICSGLSMAIMIKSAYNPCADPIFIIYVIIVRFIGICIEKLFLAVRPLVGLWSINNKVFADGVSNNDSDDQLVEVIDEHMLENEIIHKVQTDLFRTKFLKKNVAWLIENLDKIVENNEECYNYLIPKYQELYEKHLKTEKERMAIEDRLEILNLLPNNKFDPGFELSFERDSFEIPKIGKVSQVSKTIGKSWLSKAKLNLKLKKEIENESVLLKNCEICQITDHLKAVALIPFQSIFDLYKEEFKGYPIRTNHWKLFYFRNQVIRTFCVDCAYLQQIKQKNDPRAFSKLTRILYKEFKIVNKQNFMISEPSKKIALLWLKSAKESLGIPEQNYGNLFSIDSVTDQELSDVVSQLEEPE